MKKVLLIVDDEEIVYKALSVQFEKNEVEIITVKNGEDGLKTALEHHPDLILLDILMPKMDGITVLNKLREDDWGKNAKVIVLSNISDTDKVKEAQERGSDEYLIKADWSVIDVAKKIRTILELE
ncbi:MAG: response regulator [Patescibacteria group bacterium]